MGDRRLHHRDLGLSLGRLLKLRLLAAALLLAVACAQGETKIGPLTIDVPSGWLVTDRETNSLKLTNGTIADDTSTKPGTATAVFDIYTNVGQTEGQLRTAMREESRDLTEDRFEFGGEEAVVFTHGQNAEVPKEVVLFPERYVQIVYRAAYPDQTSAFFNNRDAFRAALATISFSNESPSDESGER